MRSSTDILREIDSLLIKLNDGTQEESQKTDSQVSLSPKSLAQVRQLPSFDDEKTTPLPSENDETSDVPMPPPALRAKSSSHARLYDIEDQYLEEKTSEDELESAKLKLKERKTKEIFVNTNDYSRLLVIVRQSRGNFKVFNEKSARLENLGITQSAEISNSEKTLETMQRKLIGIDNRLFEKVEDE